MRKNNKECTSKDCLKPSGLINWIRCDCCSSWYHISCVNISLSDSKKTQWFQCPLCVDVKSVNKATIGNDLVLDNYVNTAISNVRVLKRVPKNSRVPLAESLSDKIRHRLQCRRYYKMANFFNVVLVFFGATEKKWTQTDHKHEFFDKKKFEQMTCHFQNPIPKFQARL